MLRLEILQPKALPALIAISTTARFKEGSAPGRPRHTAHTWVLGAAPKAVEQPQKIFVLVSSCACTSRPMTGSKSATGISDSPRAPPLLPPPARPPGRGAPASPPP